MSNNYLHDSSTRYLHDSSTRYLNIHNFIGVCITIVPLYWRLGVVSYE
jgi:hypothetical protein